MRKIIYVIFCPIFLFSQEVVSDLISNPIIFDFKNNSKNNKSTLVLPFVDDFSYNSSNVDNNLWEKSSVFVNRNYPINPPTIGVATFDGLNQFGLARTFNQMDPSAPSDTLMSKPIDLSSFNSVYLMFYYQAKGLGDTPEFLDRLVLEFLNDTVWTEVWAINGQEMSYFEKVRFELKQS